MFLCKDEIIKKLKSIALLEVKVGSLLKKYDLDDSKSRKVQWSKDKVDAGLFVFF